MSLTGTPEGEEAMSKAALKNKKKREAKKAKEAAERAAGLGTDGNNANGPTGPPSGGRSPERLDARADGRGHQRSRSKNGGISSQAGGRSPSQNRAYRGTSPGRRHEGGYEHQGNYRGGYQGHHQQNHHRAGSGHQQQYQRHANAAPPPALLQTQTDDQAPTPDLTVTSPGGGLQDKKMRSLLKKMRAIDDLKMRQANGEKLEDTQVKKISTEELIRKELESLGFHV